MTFFFSVRYNLQLFTRRRTHLKTAVMLSIVAITYIVAFLPAWLMILEIIQFHVVVFYLYFTHHVTNPIIYAFLNEDFRQQLLYLMKCKRESSVSCGHANVHQLQTASAT